MSEAAPITVFVVLISSKTLHPATMVGACYWNQAAADAEVARLNAANEYTRARWTSRQLPFPECAL